MNSGHEDTKTRSFFFSWCLRVLVTGVLFLFATAAHADDDAAFFQQALTLINQQRAKAHAQPVTFDDKLMNLAADWAKQKARTQDLSHRKNINEWCAKFGYSFLNENIYYYSARPPADRVVIAWMNSPAHRRGLLHADIDKIGLGIARGSDGWYVVFNGAETHPPKPAADNDTGFRLNGIPVR